MCLRRAPPPKNSCPRSIPEHCYDGQEQPILDEVSALISASKNTTSVMSMYSIFNVQGLCPQTKPSKVPYLKDILNEKDQLFAALTETWLSDSYLQAELHIDGYSIFRCDRERLKAKYG